MYDTMTKTEIYYTILAVMIWFIGFFHNGKFVRPKWKIPGKFIFYVGVSFLLTHWFNHYALFFIVGHPLIGFMFHLKICKKHDINWISCEPKEKYLALQEKWAKGDFSE